MKGLQEIRKEEKGGDNTKKGESWKGKGCKNSLGKNPEKGNGNGARGFNNVFA